MRDSEPVENVREADGSGMIISEILCLFLLQKLPILLAPLSFSPLHGRVTRKSRKQVKRNAKARIVRHDNKYDLGKPKSLMFQVGTY